MKRETAIWWAYVALRDCDYFGFDRSKWEQVLADLLGLGINGITIHLQPFKKVRK